MRYARKFSMLIAAGALAFTTACANDATSPTVSITGNFASGQDVLGFTTQNGITGSYNAATGVYEDLVKAGVIDPTKVTRTALQNAASIAGLMLTTEAMISDIPEKKEPAGGGHGGHGGGMDGMY